ncbi:hypothetical protein CDAR_61641 [Caerostris darwini]|uniref:Uncharacterized protein n=1 Tax=Caerostris darwini TaxID=1538125 RepID=A0AAV4R1T0_9ARAC|nr:hypothetical protein CDAR_61641 [Caerostris darwini]
MIYIFYLAIQNAETFTEKRRDETDVIGRDQSEDAGRENTRRSTRLSWGLRLMEQPRDRQDSWERKGQKQFLSPVFSWTSRNKKMKKLLTQFGEVYISPGQ